MVLNMIILRLTEPLDSREDAMVLGRMGFLEWLVSVPEDKDFTQQAALAYERAAPLMVAVPAIRVLCELLQEAANSPDAKPDAKEDPLASKPVRISRRHRLQQHRRSLH